MNVEMNGWGGCWGGGGAKTLIEVSKARVQVEPLVNSPCSTHGWMGEGGVKEAV